MKSAQLHSHTEADVALIILSSVFDEIYYEIVHSGTLRKKDKNMIRNIAQASPVKHVHLGLRRPVDIGTVALSRRHTAQNSAFRILPTVTH